MFAKLAQPATTGSVASLAKATPGIGPALLLGLCLCTSAAARQTDLTDPQHAPAQTGQSIGGSQGLLSDGESARSVVNADIKPYLDMIEAIEQEEGAYASRLAEPLLGAGLALQRNGAHERAISLFKRGAHLMRINEGLYSPRQIALLQGEIASQVAMNAYEAADERQNYLYRVQARSLTDASRGDAYMQHARWQRQAYEAGIGEDPITRLITMRNLFRLALTEYIDVDGYASPTLLPPLYGLLQTHYLISGFVGQTADRGYQTQSSNGDDSKNVVFRGQSYKDGTSIISAIFDVTAALPESGLEERAKVSLMLGDWQLWNGKRDEALQTYAAIDGELAALEDAQVIRDRLFAQPEPLPALEGVRALPIPEAEQEGHLLLEFRVNERGRVGDVMRLDAHSANDEIASRVMRRLKQTPFRPRISDGEPVATQGLRWAYDISLW